MGKKAEENTTNTPQEENNVAMPAPVAVIDLKEQKKDYNRLVGLIKREYGKVETSSLNIAFALHQIYTEELFRIDGFKNISECGEEHFNLGKTTVNSFINVIERFGKTDADGKIIHGKEQGIVEDFEKFTWSKLCLLTSVPDEYLTEFDSSMTAKQIREKKAEIVKLINNSEEPKLIEDAENNTDVEKRASAGNDEADESATDDADAEEALKRCIIPLYSCTSMEELRALLGNDELLSAMAKHIDKLNKGIAEEKLPHIEVMFTYLD